MTTFWAHQTRHQHIFIGFSLFLHRLLYKLFLFPAPPRDTATELAYAAFPPLRIYTKRYWHYFDAWVSALEPPRGLGRGPVRGEVAPCGRGPRGVSDRPAPRPPRRGCWRQGTAYSIILLECPWARTSRTGHVCVHFDKFYYLY